MQLNIAEQKQIFRERLDGKNSIKSHVKDVASLDRWEEVCLACSNYMTAQSYGTILEGVIKNSLGIKKKVDEISGDGVCINGLKVEIKCSIQGDSNQFNFVQIRPDHKIDAYILATYDYTNGSLFFFITKAEMAELLGEHGGYAHGTIKKNGPITIDTVIENSEKGAGLEYYLRPNYVKNNDLWAKLNKFAVTSEELSKITSE